MLCPLKSCFRLKVAALSLRIHKHKVERQKKIKFSPKKLLNHFQNKISQEVNSLTDFIYKLGSQVSLGHKSNSVRITCD